MTPFKGFSDVHAKAIELPEQFLRECLPLLQSLDELKLCLYSFQLLDGMDGDEANFTASELVVAAEELTEEKIMQALTQACADGIFLKIEIAPEARYFLNNARSRAIQKAAAKGLWQPHNPVAPGSLPERPNIYRLYEQNIGPLTPLISQMLDEAEHTYPADWIEEAIKIALKKNVRSWNYVEAILRSWKEKGRNEEDRRNHKENPRSYIEGDLADYIKH